jgi:Dullard-like phosphatase family protein
VEALFNKEVFTQIDIKNIINNWRVMHNVWFSAKNGKSLEKSVNTYFVNTFRKQYGLFLEGFTKYNKIKKKVFHFMKYEFWSFFLLFYFAHETRSLGSNLLEVFKDIFIHLIKNTFYIGLILLKAGNNKVLKIKNGYMQDFINRSHSFNFKTGVPLIKTLKANNEKCHQALLSVLEVTNSKLNSLFMKSLNQDFRDYNDFLVCTKDYFKYHLNSSKEKLFKKMSASHFYGKDYSNSPEHQNLFDKELSFALTPKDFFSGSLDINKNSPVVARKPEDRSVSHNRKSNRDKSKLSNISKGSAVSKGRLSSKYSNAVPSQSKRNNLSSRNYKVTSTKSKRLREVHHLDKNRQPSETNKQKETFGSISKGAKIGQNEIPKPKQSSKKNEVSEKRPQKTSGSPRDESLPVKLATELDSNKKKSTYLSTKRTKETSLRKLVRDDLKKKKMNENENEMKQKAQSNQSEEDADHDMSNNHIQKLMSKAKHISSTTPDHKTDPRNDPKSDESPVAKDKQNLAKNKGRKTPDTRTPESRNKSQISLTPKLSELKHSKPIKNSFKKIDSKMSKLPSNQLKLQAKYNHNNAMSHTPNPKLPYNANLHSKRKSQTPDPKAAARIIEGVNRETLIKEPLTDRKYCLVLDLDETLIHFKNDNGRAKFLIRPYTYNFLRNLRQYYELIIFTAAQKEYADWILDKIDSKKLISHRFYRTHCIMSRVCHLKDISRLNRSLAKTLIVDNFQENFSLQKENGIHIKGWYGDTKDTVLETLEQVLLEMAKSDTPDVRSYLASAFGKNTFNGLSLFT